ncbi:glutathione hydrolase-like YwrD proenzyme [Trichonephila inaurata madagascariensis]|uniref:Glutathione hydrolase-like YwrD proenzyme n=1 Tax=Trichonephila inaurata madagascariensis TaxID=2747483 RepID=A0A8X7CDX1_9ARAC|nr:glutathione hydrolase-like YwrD proenzyme [Trichonephila inaurata madagascariensis]
MKSLLQVHLLTRNSFSENYRMSTQAMAFEKGGKWGSLQGLCLEGGIDPAIVPQLESKGHNCRYFSGYKREVFGKGHVIARSRLFNPSSASRSSQSWWAGADPRSDGCAMGF